MEAMKMEHVIAAPASGIVQSLAVARGDAVFEGRLLVLLDAADDAGHHDDERRATSISTPSGPISPKRSIDTRSASTTAGPTPSRGAARPDTAPRARTSTIWSTPGRSSNTVRSSSPLNAVVGRLRI